MRYASVKKWCEWPDVRPPARVYRVPQALSIAQVGQLMDAAQRLTGRHKGIPASLRWRAYVLVALATGERFAAVRQLAWSDLDGDLLTVRAETRKGWHALRQIADLPEWCTPHTLRRTAASHCRTLEDARRLLGHSSAAVTLRHYRDPRHESPATSALIDALAHPRRKGWLGWLTG